MLLPHTSQPLRDPKHIANTATPTEGTLFGLQIWGMAATADRLESPETSPRPANPNTASPSGQFTLSYRLLPFSGRTPVRTSPKMRPAKLSEYPRMRNGAASPSGDSAASTENIRKTRN